jgi:hypothetical protein
LQASQFSITELQAGELGFGLSGEGVELVAVVVYGDLGHGVDWFGLKYRC